MEKNKVLTFILLSMLVIPIALSSIPEVHAVRPTDFFTCKFVDSTGRWEKKTDQFETTDVAVYAWCELVDLVIGTRYYLRWYWRNPENEVFETVNYDFRASGNTNKAWAWMYIEGRGPEKQPGEWNCEFYYRWRGGDWQFGFKKSFMIGRLETPPETLLVTIDVNQKEVPITIDGMTYGGGDMPKPFNWDKESIHSVMVEEKVSGEEGVQYIFESWSDGNISPSRTITVMGPMTYIANYKTQYYLTVESDYSNVEGEGWYDEDEKAYAILDEAQVPADFFHNYIFKEWSGDATGERLKSKAIEMDGHKEAIAIWEKKYNMNIWIIAIIIVIIVLVAILGVWQFILKPKRTKTSRSTKRKAS